MNELLSAKDLLVRGTQWSGRRCPLGEIFQEGETL
jgi:hypothetical protein